MFLDWILECFDTVIEFEYKTEIQISNSQWLVTIALLWAQWLTWNRSRKKMNVIYSDRAQRMPDRWKYHCSHDFKIISYLCWKCVCSFYSKSFICIWREVGWIFRELVGHMSDAHSLDRMPFQLFFKMETNVRFQRYICVCMYARMFKNFMVFSIFMK